MGRRRLSKSDIKRLNERLTSLGVSFDKKDAIELVDDEVAVCYVVNGVPAFFEVEGRLLPHLKFLQSHRVVLPRVTVDMGAVPHVADGAAVMRPGVTGIEEGITEGGLCVIVDEQHGRPLAVCEASMDSAAMRGSTGGRVATSVHHVGDKFWERLG